VNVKDLGEAARALEATLVKELLQSSGAFKGSQAAGSNINADLFMNVLAEAVTKGQGLGIGAMIQKSLGPQAEASGDEPPPPADGPRPAPADTARAGAGPQVTSGFGQRLHPIDGVAHLHTGVDLRAAEGTPIKAAAGGVVRRAGARGGYGNAVEIDHGNGVSTLYAHARALNVEEGQTIEPGQAVGWVGHTGKATGPHLHFEVRVDGRPIDPRRALNAYGIRAEVTIEDGHNQPSKSR
jgi:murein DD-endopeptidase MepM/ murein hydrolase activator NlpD